MVFAAAADIALLQPVKVSARQYCSYLMDWVQQQLDDEAVFPSAIGTLLLLSPASKHAHAHNSAGVAFPRDFQDRVRNIFKRLFR